MLLIVYLWNRNFRNLEAATYWAKVLGFIGGGTYRLVDLGLIYPPVPFFVLLPFGLLPNVPAGFLPHVVTAIAGSLFLVLLERDLRLGGYPWISRIPILVLMGIHPFYLWSVTCGNLERILSLGLFYLLAQQLIRLEVEGDTRSYLNLGLVFTIYFFTDPTIVFFLIVFGAFFWVLLWRRLSLIYLWAGYLSIVGPLIFGFLSWGYLNWTFTGNFWHFFTVGISQFAGERARAVSLPWLQMQGGEAFDPLLIACSVIILAFPVLLFICWFSYRNSPRRLATFLFITLLPGLLTAAATYGYYPSSPLDLLYLTVGGVAALMVSLGRKSSRAFLTGATLFLLVGILGGGWTMARYSASGNFGRWVRTMTGESVSIPYQGAFRLGHWLGTPPNRLPTMIDDRLAAPALSVMPTTEHLILPFQNRFHLALLVENRLPPQIVVPDPQQPRGRFDRINEHYSRIYQNGLPGYDLVYDRFGWRVWRKTPSNRDGTSPEQSPET